MEKTFDLTLARECAAAFSASTICSVSFATSERSFACSTAFSLKAEAFFVMLSQRAMVISSFLIGFDPSLARNWDAINRI